jgi:uncharacterized C2H2 Zn-finger protein
MASQNYFQPPPEDATDKKQRPDRLEHDVNRPCYYTSDQLRPVSPPRSPGPQSYYYGQQQHYDNYENNGNYDYYDNQELYSYNNMNSTQEQYNLQYNMHSEYNGYDSNANGNYGYGLTYEHQDKTPKRSMYTKETTVEKDKNSDYSPSNAPSYNEEDDEEEQDEDDLEFTTSITYTCTFPSCGVIFSKSSELKAHLLSHGAEYRPKSKREYGQGNIVCPDCEKTFKRLPDLQRHIKTIHSNVKPFVCPHNCGKAFGRKDALKRHLDSKKANVACAGIKKGN